MSIETKIVPKNPKEEDVKKVNEDSDSGNISKINKSNEIKIHIETNCLKNIGDNSIGSLIQNEKLNLQKEITDVKDDSIKNIKIIQTSSHNKDMRIQSEEKIKKIYDVKKKSSSKRSYSNPPPVKKSPTEKTTEKIKSQDKNLQITSNTSNNNNISIINNASSDNNINLIKEDEEIRNLRNYMEYEKVDEKTIAEKIMKKTNFEEILKDIRTLLNKKVIIKKIVDYEFFCDNDFQIMNEIKISKIPFIINLQNYIIIVNSIMLYVEKDASNFHRLLNLLNSKFSYVERRDEKVTDFGFLTQVSYNIYTYLFSKGGIDIEDEKLKTDAKIYYQTNQNELGYLYEESNNIYLLNEIKETNYTEYPSIVYYLNKTGVQKFFENKIFTYPKIYNLKETKSDESNFSGFNEIDLCLKVNNDVKIEQNYHFNIVKLPDNNAYQKYEPSSKLEIEFKKDTIYFIEIKKNVTDLSVQTSITHIINRSDTFFQLYKNNVVNDVKSENGIQYENIFICNNKRDDVVKFSKEKENMKIFYSDKTISLNTISSLNSNIHDLQTKNYFLENDVKVLKQKTNNLMEHNEKLEKKIEDLGSKLAEQKNSFNLLKSSFVNYTSPTENYERLINMLDAISITGKNFVILYAKSMYKQDNLSTKTLSYIAYTYNECSLAFFKINEECSDISGKFMLASMNLLNKDTKLIIKDFFEQKIETAHFPRYFKSLKNTIIGEKVNEDEIEILITEQNVDIVNNIIRYLLMMEKEHEKSDIQLKFATALLQLVLKNLPENKFLEIIGGSYDKYDDINEMNERIITCFCKTA